MAGETKKINSEKFRDLRRTLSLSQNGLGAKIGITGGRVGTLEQKGGSMTLENFGALAKAAGVTPEALDKMIGGDDDAPIIIRVDQFKSKSELKVAVGKAWNDWRIRQAAKKK